MKVYKGFPGKTIPAAQRSIAIGVFDGVHRGHRRIIEKILKDARRYKRRAMIITFDPHPGKILHPASDHRIIMSLPHRLRFFEKIGVDETLVIPFSAKTAKISREAFLDRLTGALGMKTLVVGHDFRFGHRGLGDEAYLKREAVEKKFRVNFMPALKEKGQIISSTRLRQLIEKGDLKVAARMLGRPVSVHGNVIKGRGRGKGLGYPTANLNPHHETLPPAGVYAAWGQLDNQLLKGVIHIGQRPTFGDKERTLEVHFLNFHRNIYGREVELVFVKRLRGIHKFAGPGELIRAIRRDARRARLLLKRHI